MHEDEVSNVCVRSVSSLITWCNPNRDFIFSIAFLSKLLAVNYFLKNSPSWTFDSVLNTPLSWQYQISDLALKSPIIKILKT